MEWECGRVQPTGQLRPWELFLLTSHCSILTSHFSLLSRLPPPFISCDPLSPCFLALAPCTCSPLQPHPGTPRLLMQSAPPIPGKGANGRREREDGRGSKDEKNRRELAARRLASGAILPAGPQHCRLGTVVLMLVPADSTVFFHRHTQDSSHAP